MRKIENTVTIPGMLCEAVRRWAAVPAVCDGQIRMTYSGLMDRVERLGRAMLAAGLEKGERFAIWAPNCAEWIVAALAGQMAGGVLVPLNTRYKGAEAAEILRRANVRILFTVSGFLGCDYPTLLADEDMPDLNMVVTLRGRSARALPLAEFEAMGSGVTAADLWTRLAALDEGDVSDIIFTSGTTGAPKGVMTCHGQNVRVFRSWSAAVGLRLGDRYLVVNPFFHSFGYKAGWLACLLTGATVYPLAKFDTAEVFEIISRARITVFPGPPTVFQSLLEHGARGAYDLSSLRVSITGAAVVPVELVRRMREDLGFADVLTGYGLTEACGVVSLCERGDSLETVSATAGRPIKGVEVCIRDAAGCRVSPGEAGEILVRGYNVMRGYLHDAAATREAIDEEGWLHTGDIGVMNEQGYITITDRKKDMYITGGFNCFPAEIETILRRHPEIADVAVKGVADQRLGEVGHAYIIPATGADLNAAQVMEWARKNMANYKVPRYVTFVNDFPRNASGKVEKYKLV